MIYYLIYLNNNTCTLYFLASLKGNFSKSKDNTYKVFGWDNVELYARYEKQNKNKNNCHKIIISREDYVEDSMNEQM